MSEEKLPYRLLTAASEMFGGCPTILACPKNIGLRQEVYSEWNQYFAANKKRKIALRR
jgi:hypothetical protein